MNLHNLPSMGVPSAMLLDLTPEQRDSFRQSLRPWAGSVRSGPAGGARGVGVLGRGPSHDDL